MEKYNQCVDTHLQTRKFSIIQSDPKVIAQLINHNITILKLSERNARTGNVIVK